MELLTLDPRAESDLFLFVSSPAWLWRLTCSPLPFILPQFTNVIPTRQPGLCDAVGQQDPYPGVPGLPPRDKASSSMYAGFAEVTGQKNLGMEGVQQSKFSLNVNLGAAATA